MSKQNQKIKERGDTSSKVGIIKEHTDKEAVAKHDQGIKDEVEKENGPISEWENVPHLQEESD